MTPKLSAKSLPHIPGYTVWENANGVGRPGYLPGSGIPLQDIYEALMAADKHEARGLACIVLFIVGCFCGGVSGFIWFGGHGAVIGMFAGGAAGVAVGYVFGWLLVRLAAILMIVIPIGILLGIAGLLLYALWQS